MQIMYRDVRKNQSDEYSNRIIASITQNWDIVKGLNLRGRIATDLTSERIENKNYSTVPLAFGYSGGFGMSNDLYNSVYGDLLLTYSKNLNEDMSISVMGGYTAKHELNHL